MRTHRRLGFILMYGLSGVWIGYIVLLVLASWWLQRILLIFTAIILTGLIVGYLAWIGQKMLTVIELEEAEGE